MTYWVSTLAADDSGDGRSYAAAKKTIKAGLELLSAAGDILNIVNDGTYTLVAATGDAATLASVTGTSWTNFGFKIQGTDADGVPALTTLTTGATGAYFIKLVARHSYTIVQGFKFDATAAVGSASGHGYITGMYAVGATNFGPLKVRWCWVDGGTSVLSSTYRGLYMANMVVAEAGVSDYGIIEYCYFHNCLWVASIQPHDDYNGTIGNFEFAHNVFVDASGHTATGMCKVALGERIGTAGSTSSVHHNTWIFSGTAARPYQEALTELTPHGTSLWAANVLLHSNLCVFRSNAVSPTEVSPFRATNTGAATITNRTIGYNIFKYEGTAVTPPNGWYYGFVETTSDPGVGDVVLHSGTVDHSDLFYAPTTPWIWAEPLSDGGYTITLPGDLRPVYAYRAAGLAGSVPGATADSYDMAPTATASSHTCIAGATLASAVTMTDSDGLPGPLTAELVSYTGPGTLVLDSVGTFTYTANSYFVGTDTFTFRAFDGELYSDPVVVSIAITAPPIVSGAEDPDDPVSDSAYIDVLPWFEPDLQCSAVLSAQTKRNRTVHHDSRNYAQTRRWREALHRVITLGTSTTQQVTLGGIQTARSLFLETSAPIDVAVDETSAYWPVSGMVALALSQIARLYLRNNSTTIEAVVIVSAVD